INYLEVLYMDSLINSSSIFTDNGKNSREKENFRNVHFKNVNLPSYGESFSFYRSDFRGARFENCNFSKVNLDMADFIDASFHEVIFNDSTWGSSEIKNCYFNNVTFNNNSYQSSLQKSIFFNCVFINEQFDASAHDLVFENCRFENCDFEGSTFEDIQFINTTFLNCELSTMHAENFTFEHCELNNVYWGIEYWFSYFFYKTQMNRIKLKYRGKEIDLARDKEILNHFLENLLAQESYFEYFNVRILLKLFSGETNRIQITEDLKNFRMAFEKLLIHPNLLWRKKQVTGIFKLLEFYAFRDNFYLYDTMCLLEYFNVVDLTPLSISEKIEIKSEIFKLNERFIECPFEYDQILALPDDYYISSSIRLDFEDKAEAEAFLEKVFELLMDFGNYKLDQPYTIMNTKKGSWVFEILASSVLIVMLLKVLKGSVSFMIDAKARIEFNSIVLKGLQDPNALSDLQMDRTIKYAKLLQSTGVMTTKNFKPEIIEWNELSKLLSATVNLSNKDGNNSNDV
ncbi:pentapeptide repeat-containing protein, partial [Paenibacillus algorifonticola]|uniref:pentapeptide repeat-containing protein n=1 Tax=Paenibacillus algorifonticola TaxID=684063 RepID=UPI003D2BE381